MFSTFCLFETYKHSPDRPIDEKQMALFVQAIKQSGISDENVKSDQVSMELFYQSFPDAVKEDFFDSDGGEYWEVCQWPNVWCNCEYRVVQIERLAESAGQVDFAYLPEKVEVFQMCKSTLSGTLNTGVLPDSLVAFSIRLNSFEGTVDFRTLPPEIEEFNIASNRLSGSADFRNLPRSLKLLNLEENTFSGTLCLKKLPPHIAILHLSSNAFIGDFHLENVPSTLYEINAQWNQFSAVAIVPQDTIACLHKSGVTSIVNEKGNMHLKEANMFKQSIYFY